jgi:uncharacterized protein YndB with AHSA1/START domain
MALEPLVKTIEVPCSQEKAFRVFLEMSSWWPLGKFTTSAIGGAPAKSIRVEPKAGGQIVEIGHDDTEHLWGTIRTYDPFEFLRMDFHIPVPGERVESRSTVEVRFTTLGAERTRVVLTQSNWEAFGRRAQMMQGGYGKGWAVIFEQAYKAACGG